MSGQFGFQVTDPLPGPPWPSLLARWLLELDHPDDFGGYPNPDEDDDA